MQCDDYQKWWSSTWSERETILRSAFGLTEPPDTVTAFEWDDIDVRIPGACALSFPPTSKTNFAWLTITHGLTQPLDRRDVHGVDSPSAYGYEFGITTADQEPWVCNALWEILTYIRQSSAVIARGHRVPVWFESRSSSRLGMCPSDSHAMGRMRAWLFWPHMMHPAGFESSTGYFSLLVGTLITECEWELAKSTSSAHLLLLLFLAGVGQLSDPLRVSVTDDESVREMWKSVSVISEAEAGRRLLDVSQAK